MKTAARVRISRRRAARDETGGLGREPGALSTTPRKLGTRPAVVVPLLLVAAASCAQRQGAPPSPAAAALAYAAAVRAGADGDIAALSSRRIRAAQAAGAGALPISAADRADVAVAIEEAARRCAQTPCERHIRAEAPGMRGVPMVVEGGAWRLNTLPFGGRNTTVEEAVAAFLQDMERRDPDAFLILLGAQREPITRAVTERAEALKTKRGAPEVSGGKARVRIADSWWLLIESTPGGGWKVVGSEP